jgi:transposase InsO family protein
MGHVQAENHRPGRSGTGPQQVRRRPPLRRDRLAPRTRGTGPAVDLNHPPDPARRRADIPGTEETPEASLHRFEAHQPNETWQSDFTHWALADGTDTEILNFLDDHSRYLLASTAFKPVTLTAVVDTFLACAAEHGLPASTLTDNGMVYTTRLAGGRGGRNAFEHQLHTLGITQKNGSPNHPPASDGPTPANT